MGAPRRRSFRLARSLARAPLALAALVLGVTFAQGAPRITELVVDPTSGDEGETFAFRATIDNPTGSLVNHRWDFGDGTVVESIVDVSHYRHRYRDDGDYTVTLEVDLAGGAADRRSVRVDVRNVAPQITHVGRSHDPLAGAAVTFTATVVEPGDDRLTFVWDFGDGSPPVTRRDRRDVRHAYDADGAYRLTLTVTDGDDGEDTYEETVFVGTGLEFAATGAIVGSHGPNDLPSLTGMPVVDDGERLRFRGDLAAAARGESAAEGPGPCLVVLSNRGMSISANLLPGLVLHLSAALPQGLAEGTYPVASERNVIPIPLFDPYERELATPGVFYASLEEVRPPSDLPRQHGFQGTGGSLTVHRFDGVRAEITFDVRLEERLTALDAVNAPGGGLAFPPAQAAHLRGRFIHDVTRGLLERTGSINPLGGAGYGDWYLCDADERLEVLAVDFGAGAGAAPPTVGTPGPENLPWERDLYTSGDAKLEFTLDRPVLRSSLNDRTVEVDIYQTTYATTGEPFHPVPGTIEVVDERTFRFVPDTDLRPGVHYAVTLKGGRTGARGSAGETLEEDLTWRFSTRVDLATVSPQVYQVARNAMLVPGRPTMTRVYALWPEQRDLPPESQVDRFRADVTVLVDDAAVYAPRLGVEILRPDRFGQADLDAARNSVNFFGWAPTRAGGTSSVVAVVEPVDQPQDPPVRFESEPQKVRHWTETPILSVSYYFLRTGNWQDGVPVADKVRWHEHMQRGIAFAEQVFPVIEARARYGGELVLPPAPDDTVDIADVDGRTYRHYHTLFGTMRTDTWTTLRFQAATRGHGVDFVVGIVPSEVQPSLNGVMHYLGGAPHISIDIAGPRPILLFSGAPTTTLAHELAHGYGLCHIFEDADDPRCPETEYEIDAFRIDPGGRSGAAKWLSFLGPRTTHANGDGGRLVALLEEASTGDASRTFITNRAYAHLFERVRLREARRVGLPPLPAPEVGVLYANATPSKQFRLTGVVDASAGIVIERFERVDGTEAGGPGFDEGPYLAQVLSADGEVLAERRFEASRPSVSHGPTDTGLPLFEVVLPAPARSHRLVLSRDGRVLAERVRSAHPPEVQLELREGKLTWRVIDGDGDEHAVDIAYSPDGHDWTPLGVGLRTHALALPDDLEPGPRPTVRALASDGFDATEAALRLTIAPPLRVLATLPTDGDVLLRDTALMVFFNAPLVAGGTVDGGVLVRDDDGEEVPVETALVADGRGLRVLPIEPLPPGAYRATLAGVRTADGAMLEAPVTWAFTVPAGAGSGDPETGAAAGPVPDPCGAVPRDVVLALLPAGATLLRATADDGCSLEARLAGGIDDARRALELALVRARYRPTRNALEGDAVVIAFQDDAYLGESRIEPDRDGLLLRLRFSPR